MEKIFASEKLNGLRYSVFFIPVKTFLPSAETPCELRNRNNLFLNSYVVLIIHPYSAASRKVETQPFY